MSAAPILRLALNSVWSRRWQALVTLTAIALSVVLLLGVERLRTEARAGFARTIAGTDLIVGARGGSVQLLLYSVFRLGDAPASVSWRAYGELAGLPRVAWAVPLSLGDSHRGFRVLGTTPAYFEHVRYGRGSPLRLAHGQPFSDVFDTVVGATVARDLDYRIGDRIVVSHGTGRSRLHTHADKPFTVTGILAPTGTPVDRTVHVSLAGIEAIHVDWRGGVAPRAGHRVSPDAARARDLTPRSVTAVLLGLTSRGAVFQVQRAINERRDEALLAILPGVVLAQLWQIVAPVERALLAVSALVAVVGLAGLLTAMLASIEGRRREMAILRAAGAGARHVFALLVGEAFALTLAGVGAGLAVFHGLVLAAGPVLDGRLGVALGAGPPTLHELMLAAGILCAGLLAGCVPAWHAMRLSLADGLTMRI